MTETCEQLDRVIEVRRYVLPSNFPTIYDLFIFNSVFRTERQLKTAS